MLEVVIILHAMCLQSNLLCWPFAMWYIQQEEMSWRTKKDRYTSKRLGCLVCYLLWLEVKCVYTWNIEISSEKNVLLQI